jgi:hypothetical protein
MKVKASATSAFSSVSSRSKFGVSVEPVAVAEAYGVGEPSAEDLVSALMIERDLFAGRETSNLGMVSCSERACLRSTDMSARREE